MVSTCWSWRWRFVRFWLIAAVGNLLWFWETTILPAQAFVVVDPAKKQLRPPPYPISGRQYLTTTTTTIAPEQRRTSVVRCYYSFSSKLFDKKKKRRTESRRRRRRNQNASSLYSINSFTSLFKPNSSDRSIDATINNNLRDIGTSNSNNIKNNNHKPISTTTTTTKVSGTTVIPFEIEQLSERPSDTIFKEISQMCIDAFFNDGPTKNRKIPFWKDWQLTYLRTLQQSDLRIRRKRYPDTNMMFIAREVVPVTDTNTYNMVLESKPLILDLNNVYNLSPEQRRQATAMGQDYVQGEVLGFVEVTLRPYGLATGQQPLPSQLYEDESSTTTTTTTTALHQLQRFNALHNTFNSKRPVLTNLSVKYEARKSGVGSRLMERCESEVMQQSQWSPKEIILEVEDDNLNALSFYEKRGYQELFEDPAGRKFDTSGFLLRQLRCCRKVMRKDLNQQYKKQQQYKQRAVGTVALAGAAVVTTLADKYFLLDVATKTMQRLRESFFPPPSSSSSSSPLGGGG